MGNFKVLLADSDSFVYEECCRVFNGKANLVACCNDGEKLLELVESEDFDILLMDITLPKVDGLTVLERISTLDKKFKIVVMSMMNSSFVVEKSAELGVSYFMSKPIDFEILPGLLFKIWKSKEISKPTILSKSNAQNKNLDEKIANIFMTIGIPPHIRGYSYLREAIKLAVLEPAIISSITKQLYPSVAGIVISTPSKVERAIRHAIDVAWTRGHADKLNNILGVKVYVSMKPTNGEFIALIADKLLLESI